MSLWAEGTVLRTGEGWGGEGRRLAQWKVSLPLGFLFLHHGVPCSTSLPLEVAPSSQTMRKRNFPYSQLSGPAVCATASQKVTQDPFVRLGGRDENSLKK